jgi:uncharacterized protein YbjT (DUF2867 family)
MILVTGATGTVGAEVVKQLVGAGVTPRVLVRRPERLPADIVAHVEVRKGDLDDPSSLAAALVGVDRLFLLTSGVEGPARDRLAIDAAVAAGVRHVVKLSVMGAEYESITFARWHRASEKLLEASGLAWTFLRPGSFASNAIWWAETVRSQNAVYLPVGDGKSAVIDPADIGAVAVKALTERGHEGQAYVLSGPEALTVGEQAGILGRHLGRKIEHVDVPPEAARQAMSASGLPEAYVSGLLELHAATRAGQTALVTSTVRDLLGRSPSTFDTFVARNLAAWR